MNEAEPEKPTASGVVRARTRRGDISNLFDALQPSTEAQAKSITNGVGMTFVLIPAGTFMMGSPPEESGHRGNEAPVHEVAITKAFYLQVQPVSQQAWFAVMGKNPSKFTAAHGGGPAHPVEMVSWNDAMTFCERLSAMREEAGRLYRLPTEAEWEYACRAGTNTPFAHGGIFSATQGNFDARFPLGSAERGKEASGTSPTGKFPTNMFGVSDMHGNVWEWCSDWYGERYYAASALRDPAGPETGVAKVLRGGSWKNQGERCRAAYRNALAPHQRDSATGFRVVLEMGK